MARVSGKAGNVYAGLQLVHACDVVFDELVDGDVTASVDTSDYKQGSGANKFACAAGLANGDIIATDVISVDISTYAALMFWIKSSVNINTSGDLAVLVSESAQCGGSPVVFNVPILVANTWKFCKVTGDLSAMNAVISAGVKLVANDPGAFNLWVDYIAAAKTITGIRSWTLDQNVDPVEVTGFDSSAHKEYIPILTGWSGSFEGPKDGAPFAIGDIIGLSLLESATAGQEWSGIAVINGCHPKTDVNGLTVYVYDFTGTRELMIATA